MGRRAVSELTNLRGDKPYGTNKRKAVCNGMSYIYMPLHALVYDRRPVQEHSSFVTPAVKDYISHTINNALLTIHCDFHDPATEFFQWGTAGHLHTVRLVEHAWMSVISRSDLVLTAACTALVSTLEAIPLTRSICISIRPCEGRRDFRSWNTYMSAWNKSIY